MDYRKVLQDLYDQRARLDRVIGQLEKLEAGSGDTGSRNYAGRKRRGRKSMGPEERKSVSERMRRYWANRRKEKRSSGPRT